MTENVLDNPILEQNQELIINREAVIPIIAKNNSIVTSQEEQPIIQSTQRVATTETLRPVITPQKKKPFNIEERLRQDITAHKTRLASARSTGNIVPKKTFVKKIIDNNEPGSEKLKNRTSGYKDPITGRITLSKGGKKKTKKTKKIKKNKRTTKKTKRLKKNETRRR
jgi:hypothetical protein